MLAFSQGRQGMGNIYTFAAGNGGRSDTCAADGYSNSIYTISVGSAASNGEQSSFDEMCSSKMAVTFDSDPYSNSRHVVCKCVLSISSMQSYFANYFTVDHH